MTSIPAILPYIQIALSVLLIASVLLQHGDGDVGGAFGGGDNFSAAYHTRRGFEKTLFNSSIVFGVLFAAASFLNLIV